MELAKLTIKPEAASGREPFAVMFNPTELKYERSINWQEIQPAHGLSGGLNFSGAPAQTLAIDLFFDTYDPAGGTDALGLASHEQTSVLDAMKRLMDLAVPAKELHRPPICVLSWGVKIFTGVLQRANTTLTLFLANGTPVRATVSCTFQEWVSEKPEFNSPDVVKRHMVEPGDTLMGLACSYYNDRAQWRRIADANRIENPRLLVPGVFLTIPRII